MSEKFEGWLSRTVWEVALNIDNDHAALDMAVDLRAQHPDLRAFAVDLPKIYQKTLHLSFPVLNADEWQELYDHYFDKLADIRGTIVTCPVCGKEFNSYYQYAYMNGEFYCSRECYGTLFEECDDCHQGNMTVRSNTKRHNEHVCNECYNKRHGLTTVTLVWR